MLIATHARRHPAEHEPQVLRRQPQARPARPATSGPTVIRKVDSSGAVSFAGTSYRVGNTYRRRQLYQGASSFVGDLFWHVNAATVARSVERFVLVHARVADLAARASLSTRPRAPASRP